MLKPQERCAVNENIFRITKAVVILQCEGTFSYFVTHIRWLRVYVHAHTRLSAIPCETNKWFNQYAPCFAFTLMHLKRSLHHGEALQILRFSALFSICFGPENAALITKQLWCVSRETRHARTGDQDALAVISSILGGESCCVKFVSQFKTGKISKAHIY